MTKTPFGRTGEGPRQCSAITDYSGRKGACRNDAKYPDGDGVRWWCDTHNPRREVQAPKQAPKQAYTPPSLQKKEGSFSIDQKGARDLLMLAKDAQKALAEVVNMRPFGWTATTPAENYRVLMNQMCDTAQESSNRLRDQINQTKITFDDTSG